MASEFQGKNPTCSGKCRAMLNWNNPKTRAKMIAALRACPDMKSDRRRNQLKQALKNRKPFTEETKEKIRKARLLQKFPTTMTVIEKLLRDEFTRRNLPFVMHQTMFDRWQPDFAFNDSKLIVQADGDYWHNLDAAKKNDAKFNHTAKLNGWTVMRFWESQIKASTAVCADAVEAFLKKSPESH